MTLLITTTTTTILSLLLLLTQSVHSLVLPSQITTTTTTRRARYDTQLFSTTTTTSSRAKAATDLMRNVQKELENDQDASLILSALRGQNFNNDDQALAGLQMRLVDIDDNDDINKSSLQKLPLEYNPMALKQFFSSRPLAVVKRITQILSVGGSFATKIIIDTLLKRNVNNPTLEVQRAAELRDLVTSLGPFFIKIGQALSIRPDILSPRSMVELQKLCDKVPSFDSKTAYATIERELGRSIDDLFTSITPEPVAAASLGQVYKAVLRDTNETVAVKVQRPAVLETVSLDLYLAREFGLFIRNNFPDLVLRIDVVALLDEFAFRFYNELDYNLECQNGIRIARDMRNLPVVIPKCYPEYTSRRVHVAEWIDGQKLSESSTKDITTLVNLGVIAYLTQLLEGGFFHADPHPGNMMRTNDGKLAILDFGLMTEITDDQKYGIIEAVAHLINRDYDSIGQDFINLDFIPKGTDTRPIVPALKKVFDVALAGGGAKSINFQELAADLAQITFDYPFRIPPYFALVIRAISVLEGIALVGNPNFAIIDEAYPYLARRLMTNKSPRLRAALKYMVYGREGVFNAENVIDLLQALEKFTAVRGEGDGSAFKVDGVRGSKIVGAAGDFRGSQKVDLTDREAVARFSVSSSPDALTKSTTAKVVSRALDTTEKITSATKLPGSNNNVLITETVTINDEKTVREALRFFFSIEGEPFREFMLEEVVTVVDALSREAIQELLGRLGGNILPVPSFVRAFYPDLTDKDRRLVQQIRKLVQFLLGDFDGAINANNRNNNNNNSDRLQKLIPVAREYSTELRDFGTLLLARLTEKSLGRGIKWATGQLRPQPSASNGNNNNNNRIDRSVIGRFNAASLPSTKPSFGASRTFR